MTRIARRFGLVLLVLLLALLASGCRKVVSEQVLEAMAESTMLQISAEEVDVDCPSGVTMRAQEDFFCRTAIHDRRGYLLVRQLDDYGRIEFIRENPLPREEIEPRVAQYLRRQFDVDAQVTCPDEVIQEPDENFRCEVAGEPPVEVRQVDGVRDYSMRWLGADRTGAARG